MKEHVTHIIPTVTLKWSQHFQATNSLTLLSYLLPQAIKTTKAPNPNTRPRSTIFPLVAISEFPAPVELGVGDVVPEELLVGLPAPAGVVLEGEAVATPDTVEVAALAPETVDGGAGVALELEPELPTGKTTPPDTFPDDDEEGAFPAADL